MQVGIFTNIVAEELPFFFFYAPETAKFFRQGVAKHIAMMYNSNAPY